MKIMDFTTWKLEDGIELNDQFKEVLSLLENTKQSVFLTGNAGSGKTTLVKTFKNNTKKRYVIVAPTGAAAVHVGGQTIHSLFRFPPQIIFPNIIGKLKGDSIFKRLDLLIIDEISMVRADLLDGIDNFLRLNGPNSTLPFGGVQILMVGDLYQLQPIVAGDDVELFYKMYKSPYFFESNCFKVSDIKSIELKKIYRQSDPRFLQLLEKIRKNNMTSEDIDEINKTYDPFSKRDIDQKYIVLSTVNEIARNINITRLEELETEAFTYKATIEGIFKPEAYPTDEELVLKVGAQVMFLRNDSEKRWVNGTLGKVVGLEKNKVEVEIQGKYGDIVYDVPMVLWESTKYEVDKETDKIKVKKIGSFKQYPLKLAFAVSIHKCVEENQLVLTKSRGFIPIKDVNIGEYIQNGLGGYSKILNKWNTGLDKVYSIKTRCGYNLKCTKEHPILVNNGVENIFVQLKDLDKNKHMICINRETIDNEDNNIISKYNYSIFERKLNLPNKLTPELSWVLGCLVGDGYYGKKNIDRVDITTGDIDVIKRFMKIYSKYGLIHKIAQKKDNKAITLYVNSKPFRTFLQKIGLEYVTRKDKTIPKIVLNSNIENKAAFISGLLDADGSVSKNTSLIRLANNSKNLLREIRILFLQLGIITYIEKRDINILKRHAINPQAAYLLHILNSSIENFYKNIKFEVSHKQERLERIYNKYINNKGLSKTNLDIVPIDPYVRGEYRKIKKYLKDTNEIGTGYLYASSVDQKTKKILDNFMLNKIKISYDYIRLIRDFLSKTNMQKTKLYEVLSKRENENYFYDEIEYISECSKKSVYDLEIENSHSFQSNGFICHNSQGATFENLDIHMGYGAFAAGQSYVAFSRCKTLEGIKLLKKLEQKDIIIDPIVQKFVEEFVDKSFDNNRDIF